MPAKTREEANLQQRRWYEKNKQKHIAAVRAYQEKTRSWFQAWKEQQHCALCSEATTVCLDLHHTDPRRKSFEISAAVARYSRPALEKELQKCVVLCANCHRKLHANLVALPSSQNTTPVRGVE